MSAIPNLDLSIAECRKKSIDRLTSNTTKSHHIWITKKRNVRSTHAHKSVKRNKIGFSLQLKPNNILIKQSPNAHIPSLAGKSCIWANENNLVHTCLLQESALRTKELATASFGRRGL